MKVKKRRDDYPMLDIAKIREFRRKRGRTIAECARAARMPPHMWRMMEEGEVCKVGVEIVVIVSQAIPCDMKALLTKFSPRIRKVPTHLLVVDSDISDRPLTPGNRPSEKREAKPVFPHVSAASIHSIYAQPSQN